METLYRPNSRRFKGSRALNGGKRYQACPDLTYPGVIGPNEEGEFGFAAGGVYRWSFASKREAMEEGLKLAAREGWTSDKGWAELCSAVHAAARENR